MKNLFLLIAFVWMAGATFLPKSASASGFLWQRCFTECHAKKFRSSCEEPYLSSVEKCAAYYPSSYENCVDKAEDRLAVCSKKAAQQCRDRCEENIFY